MRTAVRGLGEVLITVGVVMLLFATYQLWWTNVKAHAAADREAQSIIESWEAAPAADNPADADAGPPPPNGTGIGLLTIPRLGNQVDSVPILQGVGLAELAKGLGHYPDSAMPGQPGNFAIAGHRATNGEPLRAVDELQAGDFAYVQTANNWYTYQLFRDEIVTPDSGWVIDPKPAGTEEAGTDRLITITTCHPRWSSELRWIWWGKLVKVTPKSESAPELVVSG